MPAIDLIERIRKDLESIWGEMAPHFVNKRLEDLGISEYEDLSYGDAEMVIKLLRDQTFPFFMNKKLGVEKTKTYMRWLNEERPELST